MTVEVFHFEKRVCFLIITFQKINSVYFSEKSCNLDVCSENFDYEINLKAEKRKSMNYGK